MPLSGIRELVRRIVSRDESDGNHGTDKFDKDDALAVEFVAATAALRSANYGIERKSLFEAKEWRVT